MTFYSTRDEEADKLILQLAKKKHNLIVSNDNYGDYKTDFPWIGRGSPRLKKVEILRSEKTKKEYIVVKDLNIRAFVRNDLETLAYKIIARLK